MPKASPIRTSFNAGELSPLMDGRVDVAKYNNGCTMMENFIPAVQGPLFRRGGTRFVAEVKKSSDRTWLAKFEFSNSQSFILEFGDFYIRFYYNRGQVMAAISTPYEIATPYAGPDLTNADGGFAIDMVQSGDIIYMAHPSYPFQKLSRLSNSNWTISPVTLLNGPFQDQNGDRTKTMYVSASLGTVTLTASFSAFTPAMVGTYVYLEPADLSAIKPWTAGQEYSSSPLNALRRSDGKTYKCTTSGTPTSGKVWRTGPDKPIHTFGTQADGDGNGITGTNVESQGLSWQFIDAGYGYVLITGYTSATQVTAVVQGNNPLPSGVVGGPGATFRWALGAFSSTAGYPSKVTFFRERLALARGQQIFFSVAGDFENFAAKNDSGIVSADMAIRATISSDQVNQVTWLAPSQALIIGTYGSEFVCSENSTSEAFAPGNIKIEKQTSEGSRAISPAGVGYSTLFMQRSGRKLKEAAFNFQQNGYICNDLTVLAEHVTLGGIIQMAWHREPYNTLWCARADGKLLGFTFNKEQDVVGWHPHRIGGTFNGGNAVVESVAVIPAVDGSRDDVWMVVKRTINGVTRRYVEYLNREWQTGDTQASAVYLDSSAAYSGTATSAVSGLGYLEGQTVSILADGAAHPDRVVTGGSIILQVSASVVQVGLPYTSKMKTTRIEAGAADGTSQGKTKRINKVVVRFVNTLGGEAGPDENNLDDIQFRTPSSRMDAPPPIFSGDKLIEWPSGYDFDGYVMVQQAQPLPMTIVAVMPQLHTMDR